MSPYVEFLVIIEGMVMLEKKEKEKIQLKGQ